MSKHGAIGVGLSFAACALLASVAGAADDSISVPATGPLAAKAHNVRQVVTRGPELARINTTGEEVVITSEDVWKPICADGTTHMTPEQLADIVAQHERIMAEADGEHAVVVDSFRRMGGANFAFNLNGSIPSQAPAAFAMAEAYLESIFSDPIDVTINISFANLGNGVLGATNTNYLLRSYSEVRDGLIADMDPDDELQDDLPAGNNIGVRYNGSSSSVTNEGSVFIARAAFNAAVGSIGGGSGSMTYNTNFNWDWDPTNGVGFSAFSFVDVVVHETGHALGFTSAADFRDFDIEILDLARFQRTDGTGDYNPDNIAEWTTTPRLVDFNNPNDAHNLDLVTVEYRMSDGSPYQASHFREQGATIGTMDPALSNGQTFSPNFFFQSDIDAFDFIGYDFPAKDFVPCTPDFNGDGFLNNTDINAFAAAVILSDPAADLNGDGSINNSDINLFVTLFIQGCP